ncbi:LIC_13387 family protein [Tunturiibacter lichenicola]|uniref:LIC_13387 family protein n=1 Tax=Tunturiibacter lichenicola TaxID=2051959 RepID=UPI0021B197EC|nr:hypothetical protein [Edaphobacter lichenicola]
MRAVVWLRVAAGLMLLFAIGHTYGFWTFRPHAAEGRAVWDAMNGVNFSEAGSTFSYGGFYKGFGLSISATQLFIAWLTWMLASMAKRASNDARTIAWGLFAVQCVGFVLSLVYFAVPPAVLSALGALCFMMGAVSMPRCDGEGT